MEKERERERKSKKKSRNAFYLSCELNKRISETIKNFIGVQTRSWLLQCYNSSATSINGTNNDHEKKNALNYKKEKKCGLKKKTVSCVI